MSEPAPIKRHNQLHIVDPSPAPKTTEQAIEYLRKECKVTVCWGEPGEADLLKCRLEVFDERGMKRQFYQEEECYSEDEIFNNAVILDIAKQAHAFKKKILGTGKIED